MYRCKRQLKRLVCIGLKPNHSRVALNKQNKSPPLPLFFLPNPYLFIILEQMKLAGHLSDFELIVMLVLLRLGDEAYGVPIARDIEEQTRREVKLGSVYATLDRLEEKGYVVSALGEPTQERGGRAKRYFHVTKPGMREVRETRRMLTKLWRSVPELAGGRL